MPPPDHAARSKPVEHDQTSKVSARSIPSIGHLASLRPSSLPTTLPTGPVFAIDKALNLSYRLPASKNGRIRTLDATPCQTMPRAANLSSSIRRARCPRAASPQSAIFCSTDQYCSLKNGDFRHLSVTVTPATPNVTFPGF